MFLQLLLISVAFGVLYGCEAGKSRPTQLTSDAVTPAIPATTESPYGGDLPSVIPSLAGDGLCSGQQPNGITEGSSLCCNQLFAVCDGFEDRDGPHDVEGEYWEVEKFNREYGLRADEIANPNDIDQASVVEISSARAARGKSSLHIVAQNSNQLPNNGWHHAMMVNRTLFPAPNNTFWGRAFVYYVDDEQSAFPNGHVTLANASGTVTGDKTYYTWWRVSTWGHFVLNCEHGDQGETLDVRMPVNRWACLEWQYRGDSANEIYLYMDGNRLVNTTKFSSTTDNSKGSAPVYDAFRLGFEVYGYQYNPTPKQFDMYFDEVALDYNRIGCDR